MELTAAAQTLLAVRYLLPGEDPPALFARVAGALGSGREQEYLRLMENLLFLPNTPTLLNAGTETGQLSACFVLPVEDSLVGIFRTLTHMALIHQTGGGTGFSFGRLRPRGDRVNGTLGTSNGPIPFMRVFDEATNAVKQGGKRRGANMGVLASSHPDIRDFIAAKLDGGLRNFNISVGFERHFFDCLAHDAPYELVNPRDGGVWDTIQPSLIWRQIIGAAWRTGDPGILFFDIINEKNTVPGLGPMEATNPCGEQPLLPYESCNLGSINLSRFVNRGEIDWDHLRDIVRTGVRFLDTVIDMNKFPIPEIREQTLITRKIGLGVMGLADAFILLGIPYESDEALDLAGRLMAFIQKEARGMSRELGEEKGSFPAIDKSIFSGPMRNATVTTVAPTGSLHLIAGTTSGIEPIFSLAYHRSVDDRPISVFHPLAEKYISSLPSTGGVNILAQVRRTGSLRGTPLPDDVKDLYRTAPEISPEHHVRMQAVVQQHVENAVSKTVNLPENATPDDIGRIYLLARELRCKGITVYRYNSKPDQVLSRGCETCRADV
jgi:ribonucleoside-diphosphate reductase alpha chain